MSIYTKKGDKGRTSLGSGVRVWKDSARVDAYGTIDELNSVLGIVESEISLSKKKYAKFSREIIITVQNDLFCIGSYLSNPANANLIDHLSKNTSRFEKDIDFMTSSMPPLENFILPGGGKAGAYLQLARAVSRRAERKLVSLIRREKVNNDVVQYVNRLSDLLFTLSRFTNFNEKRKEIIWKKR